MHGIYLRAPTANSRAADTSTASLPSVRIAPITPPSGVFSRRGEMIGVMHGVLATVDAADIRGLATARLLCVADLPQSRDGHRSRSCRPKRPRDHLRSPHSGGLRSPSASATSIVSLWTSGPTNMLRFPMTYLLGVATCEASDTPQSPRRDKGVGLCWSGTISARSRRMSAATEP